MAGQLQTLGYARDGRKRRWRLWLMAAVLAAGLVALWWAWPAISLRMRLLHAESRCRRLAATPGAVLYREREPGLTPAWIDPVARQAAKDWHHFYLLHFEQYQSHLLGPSVQPWEEPEAVVYLDIRELARGERWVVAACIRPDNDPSLSINFMAVPLVPIVGEVKPFDLCDYVRLQLDAGGAAVEAGRSDPNDPAHFELRLVVGDQPLTVDGRLSINKEGGRCIRLKGREGVAAAKGGGGATTRVSP